MRVLITILFALVLNPGWAQTEITVHAPSFANNRIKINGYEDYLTYKATELAKVDVDSTGSFSIVLNVNEVQLVTMFGNGVSCGFYIEPNARYTISLQEVDTNFIYDDNPINITPNFENYDSGNINYLISKFNEEYDQFVSKNLNSFIKKTAKTKVDTFALKIQRKYKAIENEYFQMYIKYSLAILKSVSAHSQKKQLYKTYLDTLPILYHHDMYMDYFNQFYTHHFKTLNFADYEQLVMAIKTKVDRSSALEVLGRDAYLKNDSVCELVLIKGLMENYRNPEFSKKSILAVLEQVQAETSIEEHKRIAANVYNKLSSVDVGSYAPELILVDFDGNKVTLTDLLKSGKYIYLDFWATWCQPCVREMKLTPELVDRYGDYIEFVSISMDKKSRTAERFVKKNKYEWTFLHFGGDESIITTYKTRSIPTYYLIDPNGKIVQSPARRPSSIVPYFNQIEEMYKR